MTEQENEPLAIAGVFGAVVAWTAAPLSIRGIDSSLPTIVFWRMLLAVPVMLVFARVTGGGLSLSVLRRSIAPGILHATSMITSFAAVQRTSIANAMLITAMMPAVMLLLAPRLFGERWNPRQIALAAVAFVGVAGVIIGAPSGGEAHRSGDLFAVVSLVISVGFFVMIKRVRDDGVHAPSFLAGMMFVGFVVAAPWALIATDDLGGVDGTGWLLISVIVLMTGVVGHGLMVWAQAHVQITVGSLITLLQPVLGTVGAWIIYDQRLRSVQLICGAVVLIALAGLAAEARPTPARRAALSAVAE